MGKSWLSRHRRAWLTFELLEGRALLNATPVLELKLDVTQNGESIVNENREFHVLEGDRFDLELRYDDRRGIFESLGAFTVYADIFAANSSAFIPILSESQIISLSENLEDATGGHLVLSAGGLSAEIPLVSSEANLANSAASAIKQAIEVDLGFGEGAVTVFELLREPRDREGTVGSGDPFQYLVRFVGEAYEFADVDPLSVDASNIVVSGSAITASLTEIDVFLDDPTVDPPELNPEAFLYNIDARSSTFNNAIVYGNIQMGDYVVDQQNGTAVFNELGGTGPLEPGGIPDIAPRYGVPATTDNVEVVSIRLLAVSSATNVDFTLTHADGPNSAVSVYGLDDALTNDEILIDLEDDALVPGDDRFGLVLGTILPIPEIIVNRETLNTSEAGQDDSFSISLGTMPLDDVIIELEITDPSEATLSTTQLTFTPTNATTPQTVTVFGVDDSIDDGDQSYSVEIKPVVSNDPFYNGADPPDVSGSNADNDTAGITLSPTNGLQTSELGGEDTFSVVLDSEPLSTVAIGLVSSDPTEAQISQTDLTFTTENWNIPQSITVVGQDDPIDDGDAPFSVSVASVESLDPKYDQVFAASVSGVNSDDDEAGISISGPGSPKTSEAGEDVTFSVSLETVPTQNVVVELAVSDASEGQLSRETLTFTPANGLSPLTFTVTGVDDQVDDGDVNYSVVTSAAVSSDSNYAGINPSDISLINEDNDVAGITLDLPADLATSESGSGFTFSVALDTIPTANVLIPVGISDSTEASVSSNTLFFTPENAMTPQSVTVSGKDDDEIDGDIPFEVSIGTAITSDAAYRIDLADISAINLDDDSLPTLWDFGDAPSPYPTTLSDDGARHGESTLSLGMRPTFEADGQPSNLSDADSREDGVVFQTPLITSASSISIASATVSASATGRLDAWIDFNQDGDWLDAGEQIANDLEVQAGDNLIEVRVPANSLAGETVGRFRISSSGDLDSTGEAADGEVEDHRLTLIDGNASDASADIMFSGEIEIQDRAGVLSIIQNEHVLFSTGSFNLRQLNLIGSPQTDRVIVEPLASSELTLSIAFGEGFDSLALVNRQTFDLSNTPHSFQDLETIEFLGPVLESLSIASESVESVSDSHNTLELILVQTPLSFPLQSWGLTGFEIVEGKFIHRLASNDATVRVAGLPAWTNPVQTLDVNNNGRVTAIDALQILNQLGTRKFLATTTSILVNPVGFDETFPEKYYDTTKDGLLTPIDALRIINFIGRGGAGEAEQIAPAMQQHSEDQKRLVLQAELAGESNVGAKNSLADPMPMHGDDRWAQLTLTPRFLESDEQTHDIALDQWLHEEFLLANRLVSATD